MTDTPVGNSCAVNGLGNSPAHTQRASASFSSVIWSRNTAGYWVSACGRYEISPRYTDGHFAWRGREVSTDKLICSSLDPDFVKYRCESHAASVAAEAGA